MDRAERGFARGFRSRREGSADEPRFRDQLAHGLPLVVFGGVCVALATWVAFTDSKLLIGRYELWPYLATVGTIGLLGGLASGFARWDEEEGTAGATGAGVGPDEIVVSRSEWERLQRSGRRASETRPSGPTGDTESTFATSRGEDLSAPSALRGGAPHPPAASAAAASGPTSDSGTDSRPVLPPPPSRRSPGTVAAAVAGEKPPKTTAPEPPSQPRTASVPAASAVRPEVRNAIESLLANLAAKAAVQEVPTSPESPSSPASVPVPVRPPALSDAKASSPPSTLHPAPAPPARDAAEEASPGASASPEVVASENASPALSTKDTDIQREFDQLLEALSAEPAPLARALPQCIACDRAVQLPYVSCQSCANPLCPECTAKAEEEGHPRKCPTCALLQKYS